VKAYKRKCNILKAVVEYKYKFDLKNTERSDNMQLVYKVYNVHGDEKRTIELRYEEEGGTYILTRYLGKEEKPKKGMMKCEKYSSHKYLTYDEMKAHNDYMKDYVKEEIILPKPPEYYGLLVPKPYKAKPVKVKVEKDNYVTDDMIAAIAAIENNDYWSFNAIMGEAYDRDMTSPTQRTMVYCSRCGKTEQRKETEECSCGKMNLRVIHNPKYIEAQKSYGDYWINNSGSKIKDYARYIEITSNALYAYVVKIEIEIDDEFITKRYSVANMLIHEIGGKMEAYLNDGKLIKCEPFYALAIIPGNPKTYTVFRDYNNIFEAIMSNEEFFKKCGFIETLKYQKDVTDIEMLFLRFICILNKYPVLEQILKAGYTNLFFSIYTNVYSTNIMEMTFRIESVKDIINQDATTSKKALRFPDYIGEYLERKNAIIDEYRFWVMVYELTGISKEQFNEIIDSFEYAYVSSQVKKSTMGNILKYGYSLKKLLGYLIKKASEMNYNVMREAHLLSDYLMMCEAVGVTPDYYPQDLYKQHDDIMKAYQDVRNKAKEDCILEVAHKCEDIMKKAGESKNKPECFDNYVIKFPHSTLDFIEEGNNMHNCVGGYAEMVSSHKRIIFFLREKDTPSESYITGEITSEGLGQFYLSNNRVVQSSEMIDLGKYVVDKILSGISSGPLRLVDVNG